MRTALSLLAVLLAAVFPLSAAGQAPNPQPPAATTGPAEAIGQTTATLTGTVDPHVSATTYSFEYGTSSAYGLQTAEQAAGDGDGAVTIKVPVEGLTHDTTYHYRLVATNAAGVSRGADRTLRTAASPANPRPPSASTGAA
jgi:phosphodiesterase/alkaline phosphatase D-like protein